MESIEYNILIFDRFSLSLCLSRELSLTPCYPDPPQVSWHVFAVLRLTRPVDLRRGFKIMYTNPQRTLPDSFSVHFLLPALQSLSAQASHVVVRSLPPGLFRLAGWLGSRPEAGTEAVYLGFKGGMACEMAWLWRKISSMAERGPDCHSVSRIRSCLECVVVVAPPLLVPCRDGERNVNSSR